jgi:Flp pilus assembly protein TadD
VSLPDDQRDALSVLARLFLTHGFPERSVRLYGALTVLEPADPHHLRGLALAQTRAGRLDAALDSLDRLALGGHTDEGFHMLRSEVLARLDRHEESASAMRAYLTLKESAT